MRDVQFLMAALCQIERSAGENDGIVAERFASAILDKMRSKNVQALRDRAREEGRIFTEARKLPNQ